MRKRRGVGAAFFGLGGDAMRVLADCGGTAKTARTAAGKPTIIDYTTRLDPLGVEPAQPEGRDSPLDINWPIRTPDGEGRVHDVVWAAAEPYYVVEFPDGTLKNYEFGEVDRTTPQRQQELEKEKSLEAAR